MTDFKASIIIKFHFMGKDYKTDMWINYWDNGDGIDDRIVEWFRECYEDGMARHDKQCMKIYTEEHEGEIEKNEKAELKRLKEKYKDL